MMGNSVEPVPLDYGLGNSASCSLPPPATGERTPTVPKVFEGLENWVILIPLWKEVCETSPSLNRPDFDVMIFTCLVGRGRPNQLPESIRQWAQKLCDGHPIAALKLLRTTNDPVHCMLFLSFLFALEWLMDYPRDFEPPLATYVVAFNEWVTSQKYPDLPDARCILYQLAAALLYVEGKGVGNHEAIHPHFLTQSKLEQPDIGARMYWLFRLHMKMRHEGAYKQVAKFIEQLKKEEEASLSSITVGEYPKERADPQF
ncbi:hypothetical protein B0H63DRAFT_490384 [Podospora didyma]|uniref:Uncharacterized protein n=1 Tax=Podospora didyma TaxID=330526 RepID=A0AAE0N192_9PEZI|nr:hypothetical protein B0H63DRAFT_490384 [Podospora didyma]